MVVIRHVLILLDHITVTVIAAFSLSILVNVKVYIHVEIASYNVY